MAKDVDPTVSKIMSEFAKRNKSPRRFAVHPELASAAGKVKRPRAFATDPELARKAGQAGAAKRWANRQASQNGDKQKG